MPFLVLSEAQVSRFSFFLNECIKNGMRYNAVSYELAYACERLHQCDAYKLAVKLSTQGIQTAITVSQQEYKVWRRLTSTDCLHCDELMIDHNQQLATLTTSGLVSQ